MAEGSRRGRVRRRALGGSFDKWAVKALRYFAIVNLMGGMAHQ